MNHQEYFSFFKLPFIYDRTILNPVKAHSIKLPYNLNQLKMFKHAISAGSTGNAG